MVPIVSVLGSLTVVYAYISAKVRDTKTLALTIRCVGLILWPVVLTLVCPWCPATIPGTLWLCAFTLADALVLKQTPSKTGLSLEKNSFVGVVFAIASMCGNRPDGAQNRLFLYPVLMMLLAVSPTHDLPREHATAVLIENVQRVTLHYCIAVLLTAIALSPSGVRPRRHTTVGVL